MGKVLFTKGKQKKTILLDYRSWLIILEPCFPSHNYILTKKNASHGFHPAYCGSLDSALKLLFDQLVIANIDENGSYGKKFADLHEIIIQTKKEFSQLISPDVKELICEGEWKNTLGLTVFYFTRTTNNILLQNLIFLHLYMTHISDLDILLII